MSQGYQTRRHTHSIARFQKKKNIKPSTQRIKAQIYIANSVRRVWSVTFLYIRLQPFRFGCRESNSVTSSFQVTLSFWSRYQTIEQSRHGSSNAAMTVSQFDISSKAKTVSFSDFLENKKHKISFSYSQGTFKNEKRMSDSALIPFLKCGRKSKKTITTILLITYSKPLELLIGCYAKVQLFPSSSVLCCFHFISRRGIKFNTETCKAKKKNMLREVGSERKLRFGTRQWNLTMQCEFDFLDWKARVWMGGEWTKTTSLQGLLEYC